jgi:hypothetical protein
MGCTFKRAIDAKERSCGSFFASGGIEVEVDCGDILHMYFVQQFAKSMSFVVILQRHKSRHFPFTSRYLGAPSPINNQVSMSYLPLRTREILGSVTFPSHSSLFVHFTFRLFSIAQEERQRTTKKQHAPFPTRPLSFLAKSIAHIHPPDRHRSTI